MTGIAASLAIAGVLDADVSAQAQEAFIGTVVYEASAGGTSTEGAQMFSSLGPRREVVTWGSGGRLRLETTGGMLEGIIT